MMLVIMSRDMGALTHQSISRAGVGGGWRSFRDAWLSTTTGPVYYISINLAADLFSFCDVY